MPRSQIERALRRVPTRPLVWLVTALCVVLVLSTAGCSQKEPPEDTLSALAVALGDSKLDDVDFESMLSTLTTEDYRINTEPDQANYQLFLTAKAAGVGLDATEDPNIRVESDVSGDDATVSFVFTTPEGIFAVADLARIDVSLVYTEEPTNPWRIESITLSR